MGDRRNVLVTGGAGFIGAHLVDALLARGDRVRVLDDLSTGDTVHPQAQAIVGDVADVDLVARTVDGVDVVFHHAAHRAVLRSVEHPLTTDRANTFGTLNVLKASVDAGVRRVVYASSSSVYGGADILPTPVDAPLVPRSPYAVSKVAGEHYCRVFTDLYGLETVSLRYFNVYGPRQRPDSRYAAVIPLFISALEAGERPEIHGDGLQSRDFTYIADVVAANLRAADAAADRCSGLTFNVAGGRPYSLLELLDILSRITGQRAEPRFTSPRPGDVRHTWADISLTESGIGYRPEVPFEEGLRRTVEWFREAWANAARAQAATGATGRGT
jgi:UDP-glucose 4-epimerase